MLNNHLIEVYNADSIHNGPIFDPLDGATAVTGAVWARLVMATDSSKTLCHCIQLCAYTTGRLNDSLAEVYNGDSKHN